jgi:predicted metalloendopeptidase
MFGNLKEVFKTNVRNADWVDAESRELIIQKVDNIVLHLGYPDFVEDKTRLDTFYENVRICEWDNYGNAQRIRAFKKAYALSRSTERTRSMSSTLCQNKSNM